MVAALFATGRSGPSADGRNRAIVCDAMPLRSCRGDGPCGDGPYGGSHRRTAICILRPDLLDLNLRGVYSYAVIETLAKAGTPLVVCSGYAGLPDMRTELAGVVLLPKPCDLKMLQARLAEQFAASPQTTS